MIKPSETSDILQQQLDNVDLKAEFEEIGTVLEVGDGVANVFGLDNVTSGELIEFENGVSHEPRRRSGGSRAFEFGRSCEREFYG